MSTLHPDASLYEDVTDEVKVEECFNKLEKILKRQNIELIKVRSALKLNRTALITLAADSLTYEVDETTNIDETSPHFEKFMYYLSDKYKNEVLGKLSEDQLVDVVLNNPRYKLRQTEINTFIEPTLISFNPLGNLIFCRINKSPQQKG